MSIVIIIIGCIDLIIGIVSIFSTDIWVSISLIISSIIFIYLGCKCMQVNRHENDIEFLRNKIDKLSEHKSDNKQ